MPRLARKSRNCSGCEFQYLFRQDHAGAIHGLLLTLPHNPAPWALDRTEGGCTSVHSERLALTAAKPRITAGAPQTRGRLRYGKPCPTRGKRRQRVWAPPLRHRTPIVLTQWPVSPRYLGFTKRREVSRCKRFAVSMSAPRPSRSFRRAMPLLRSGRSPRPPARPRLLAKGRGRRCDFDTRRTAAFRVLRPATAVRARVLGLR